MSNSTERPPHTATDQRERFSMVYATAFAKWREPGTKLTPVCMMVYLALGFRADFARGTCFPSIDLIAEDAGCSRRSVIDALKTLESEGLISVQAQYKGEGRQTSNLYTILDTGKNLHPNGQSGRGAKNNTPRSAKNDTPGGVQNLHSNDNHKQQDTTNNTLAADESAEPQKPKKRRHRIPDDFEVDDELREYARSKGLTDEQIDIEAEKFIAYWQGDGRPKADWRRTWQTWVMSAKDRQRFTSKTSPNSTAHTDEENADYTGGMEDWGGVEIIRARND